MSAGWRHVALCAALAANVMVLSAACMKRAPSMATSS